MQEKAITTDFAGVPNIGGVLAEKLTYAGITSYAELASLGSVEAALRIRAGVDPGACYNMLYALEGAIRGVRWHTISRQERDKLKREFDHAAGRSPREGFGPRRGHLRQEIEHDRNARGGHTGAPDER